MMLRRTIEQMYHSPFGRLMSFTARQIARLHQPFMVYGHIDPATGEYRKYTRISSSTSIVNKHLLSLGDHIWIWHHSIIDCTGGVIMEDGCSMGAWSALFTHSSINSNRLLGRQMIHIPNQERKGYTRAGVKLGAFSAVGTGAVVLPGVTIGKGCVIGTSALVNKDVPDFAVVVGIPAKVIGNTLDIDKNFFLQEDYSATYYDLQALELVRQKLKAESESSGAKN